MKTRVLIVDDEDEFVQTLSERLILRDFDVTAVSNGADAIEKVETYNFDIVILDVQMPGINGIDVLKEIKTLKPLIDRNSKMSRKNFARIAGNIDEVNALNSLKDINKVLALHLTSVDNNFADAVNCSTFKRITNAQKAEEQVDASKALIQQRTSTALLAQANMAPKLLLSIFG